MKEIMHTYSYWKADIDPVFWVCEWRSDEAQKILFDNREEFLRKYYELAISSGILIPIHHFFTKKQEDPVAEILKLGPLNREGHWLHLVKLYSMDFKQKPVFPNMMIVHDNSNNLIGKIFVDAKHEVDFEPDSKDAYYEPLLKIWVMINSEGLKLMLTLTSNAFFPDFWDGASLQRIDNDHSAKFNTPRVNSFLKGLKSLSKEYGMDHFSFDNPIDDSGDSPYFVSEDGILNNGDIYYLENIDLNVNKFMEGLNP